MDTSIRTATKYLFLLSPLWSAMGGAAQWSSDASIETSVTFSDNIYRRSENVKSDMIFAVTPGISLVGQGSKMSLSGKYDVRGQHYVNDTLDNKFFHNLQTDWYFNALENRLDLNANLTIDQTLTSIDNGLIPDYSSGTDNLSTVGYATTGFNWRQPLGNISPYSLVGNLYYTDQESHDDSFGYNLNFNTASGNKIKRGFWDLSYSQGYSKARNNEFTLTQMTRVNTGVEITKHLSLLARFFWEENDIKQLADDIDLSSADWGPGLRLTSSRNSYIDVSYNFSLKNSNSDYWGVNFDWTPSIRTHFSGSYGKRFYGDAYSFDFTHKTRKLRTHATYQESIETFSHQVTQLTTQGSLICPQGTQIDLSECEFTNIANPVVPPGKQLIGLQAPLPSTGNDVYLNRYAAITSSVIRGKHTLTASLFYAQRNYYTQLKDTDDYGVSLAWSIKVGAKTNAQFSTNIRYLSTETGVNTLDKSNEQNYEINLFHSLSRATALVATYSHGLRHSDLNPYRENLVSLSYQIFF